MIPETAMQVIDQYFPALTPHLVTHNATVSQNMLYGGMDLNQLPTFERAWANYYIWIGNPIVATGLLSFLIHEVVYFGRCIPWLIIDAIPFFHKWKIQQDKSVSNEMIWHCTKVVLLTHFTCEFPLIYLFHPICCYFGMSTYEVPFTPLPLMIAQIAFFFVFEDTFHYFAHRALHWGPLYRHIHKLHHTFSAPIGLAAEYAHPLEVLILAQGTISGPFLYCLFRKDLHILTVYIWVTLRLFQAVDAHSGYDFPWSLRHIVPFWAGADHHDFHHASFLDCYSTSFRWWDHLLGTDKRYKRARARAAAAKAADRARIEKEELDKAEREGTIAERELCMVDEKPRPANIKVQ